MKKYFKLLFLTSLLATGVNAQNNPDLPVDGYYNQNGLDKAKPYEYPEIDKNNVKFYKRIWREIDVTDPKNQVFILPGRSLMEVIVSSIDSGKIIAYDPTSTKNNPTGDAFVNPFTPQQAMGRLTDSVLVPRFDDEGNQVGAEMQLNDFNPAAVTRFRIKEDIFFDKQRSRIESRIIGLAPLMKINAGGEMVSEQPAFWLYFPQCRKVFATIEVGEPLSLDDVFIQSLFTSRITKEVNATDLSTKEYQDSEKLEESKTIEQEINEYKKKTWKY